MLPIEFTGLTKRYGTVHAVRDLTATVSPGRVTGFLGPNGAGKTTTLRMLLGLIQPSQGTATIGGVPYRQLENPLTVIGTALEATAFHPGRTGRGHLAVSAAAAGIPQRNINNLLETVNLTHAADRRIAEYSLGMRQRLGLACALLGNPHVVVLDEPINGLDPEGILWIRGLLRNLAAEGRTVLVSSHLLTEVQQTVDDLLIIREGTLQFSGTLAELEARGTATVLAVSPNREGLWAALVGAGLNPQVQGFGFTISGVSCAHIGALAFREGVELHELREHNDTLEHSFFDLMQEAHA